MANKHRRRKAKLLTRFVTHKDYTFFNNTELKPKVMKELEVNAIVNVTNRHPELKPSQIEPGTPAQGKYLRLVRLDIIRQLNSRHAPA